MRIFVKSVFFLLIIILFSGCASIVSKSTWPFSIDTEPAGAKILIKNKSGKEIFRGKTPTALKLKSGAGFFSKESYTVILTMAGYEPKTINVACKLNGWYLGNIVFGGFIGLLIIDPATGAMYKLESLGISEELVKLNLLNSGALHIINKNQVPVYLQQHLVEIKE